MERYIEEMQADTHRKLSMEDPQLSGSDFGEKKLSLSYVVHPGESIATSSLF